MQIEYLVAGKLPSIGKLTKLAEPALYGLGESALLGSQLFADLRHAIR
jgi:hypothetical protein